ncbi:cyclin B1 interacting protein 1, E3 ubiquitin protein ligase [Chamberlinius hualienensis]
MDDQYLKCNIPACGKLLTDTAWVTFCSHIFCDEDGTKEFSNSTVCPACKSDLRGKDLYRQNLNPDEKTKSLLLIGLAPTTVMEIANRAISFWAYQTQQQISHQEDVISSLNEKLGELERSTEQTLLKSKAENDILKAEIRALEVDQEEHKFRLADLNEKLNEKTRQLQKTKSFIDCFRRQQIYPAFSSQKQPLLLNRHELSLALDEVTFQPGEKHSQQPVNETAGNSYSDPSDDVQNDIFPF